jgi:hypothetical protein
MKTREGLVALLLIAALAVPAAPAIADTLPATARKDVRAALLERGVDVSAVDARVRSLTDEEAVLLAQRIDELPAGGRAEALPMLVLAAVVVYYLWPVILFAGGVAIVRALDNGAPTKFEPAAAYADAGLEEGGWKRH